MNSSDKRVCWKHVLFLRFWHIGHFFSCIGTTMGTSVGRVTGKIQESTQCTFRQKKKAESIQVITFRFLNLDTVLPRCVDIIILYPLDCSPVRGCPIKLNFHVVIIISVLSHVLGCLLFKLVSLRAGFFESKPSSIRPYPRLKQPNTCLCVLLLALDHTWHQEKRTVAADRNSISELCV